MKGAKNCSWSFFPIFGAFSFDRVYSNKTMTIVRLEVAATGRGLVIPSSNLAELQAVIQQKEGLGHDLYRLETLQGKTLYDDSLFSPAPVELRLNLYYTLDGGCSVSCCERCGKNAGHENMCGCAPLGFGCARDCKTCHFCFLCTLCGCRDSCLCCKVAKPEHFDK